MFSWPVSSPFFFILHADLWMPGHFKDRNGNVALMNVMCDMTQFAVVVRVKFGVCHLVILDDGSPFKGVFSAICKALRINYEILAKRNHKGLLVEKFHRFLNKVITIAAEDRGTNDIFVAAGVVAGYAWNSSPIDRTDILRSVPAIGRKLRFTLDVDVSALPALGLIMLIRSFTTFALLILTVTLILLS